MKKIILGIGLVFMIVLAGRALAEEMTHGMEHGMAVAEEQPMGQMGAAMDEMNDGESIHSGVVEGYHFSYQLMDIRERMAAMKAAGHAHEGMGATHHLMVFIRDPDGATVGDAKVGYFVEGPDGTTQKLMCMGMNGGYGADVNFSSPGSYVVKTKAVAGDVKLVDEFTYTAE